MGSRVTKFSLDGVSTVDIDHKHVAMLVDEFVAEFAAENAAVHNDKEEKVDTENLIEIFHNSGTKCPN